MQLKTLVRSFKTVDKALLNHASELIVAAREEYRTLPVVDNIGLSEQKKSLEELRLPNKVPMKSIGSSTDVLDAISYDVLDTSTQLYHPGFIAHMDPPTAPIAIAAGMMQIATNQNLLHPDVAPKAREIEKRVIEWLAPYYFMEGGHIVPGSSVANLTALWVARENRGITTVVASDKSHLSIKKSANLLGLHYIECTTNDNHEMNLDELESIIELDKAALVLTAGTVATGSFDPIKKFFGIVNDRLESSETPGFLQSPRWVHIDAAWAGPLQLSSKYNKLFDGIQQADSIGFSAHKWLYQPKGCALCLFRDVAEAHESISYGGSYLGAPNIGVLGTSSAAAIPLCATILNYGIDGVVDLIEKDMERADALIDLLRLHEGEFEVFGKNVCAVVVWRPRHADVKEVRGLLQNGWVSLCEINEELWFRSVFSNPNADPQMLFNEVLAAINRC
eukprot:g7843.t1